jgi:hypothetical protein
MLNAGAGAGLIGLAVAAAANSISDTSDDEYAYPEARISLSREVKGAAKTASAE